MTNRVQADAKDGDKAAPGGTAATSDVDRLLAEFETGTKPETAPRNDVPLVKPFIEAMKPVAAFAERKMREEQDAEARKSVDHAIGVVKEGDDLKDIPDRVVRGFLRDLYNEDADFRAAHDKRGENAKAWNAALVKARESFTEDVKTIAGKNARSDVEAAKAAVRGSGRVTETKTDENPEALFNMSDADFRKYKQGLDAKARAGTRP